MKWMGRLVLGVVMVALLITRAAPWRVSQELEHKAYLPYVVKSPPCPDRRFGIAEHSLEEMLLLGFPNDGRYHSVQWTQPEKTDTVRFLRPASRDHASTWLLGTYDTETGAWTNEVGFRRFVCEHDSVAYVVGNELLVPTPIGDSNVTPTQYARWYRDAWILIKAENPTALVGPFGPVGPVSKSKLVDVWCEYQVLTGQVMPVDFFPLHHYTTAGAWALESEVASVKEWIGWLDGHNPDDWCWVEGPDYWLTEYGFRAWAQPIEQDEALCYMEGFTGWLRTNDLGVEVFAWWPSGNAKWPGQGTWLVKDGQVTALGRLYYELAVGGTE